MSKENLPSEEALFKLLALPPSRANDNNAANTNVSRLEIKYPLPTTPETVKEEFFSTQRLFLNIKDFSAEKMIESTSYRSRLLLFMYYSPQYSRFVRADDAQQIYNFNQRSDAMFGRSLLFGGVCYCAYLAFKLRFGKLENPVPILDYFKDNIQGIIVSSLASGIMGQMFWEVGNWNVIVSSIKPYDMDEPERAAAYKSVYRELVQLNSPVYDKLLKGLPLDAKEMSPETLNQKILFENRPKVEQVPTPKPSFGKQAVAGETLYSSLTRDTSSLDMSTQTNSSQFDDMSSSANAEKWSFEGSAVPKSDKVVEEEKFVEKIEFK